MILLSIKHKIISNSCVYTITVFILCPIHVRLHFIPHRVDGRAMRCRIISDSLESNIVQTGSEIPDTISCSLHLQTKPSPNFNTDASCIIADRSWANSSCNFYVLAFLPCCTRYKIAINRERTTIVLLFYFNPTPLSLQFRIYSCNCRQFLRFTH